MNWLSFPRQTLYMYFEKKNQMSQNILPQLQQLKRNVDLLKLQSILKRKCSEVKSAIKGSKRKTSMKNKASSS